MAGCYDSLCQYGHATWDSICIDAQLATLRAYGCLHSLSEYGTDYALQNRIDYVLQNRIHYVLQNRTHHALQYRTSNLLATKFMNYIERPLFLL